MPEWAWWALGLTFAPSLGLGAALLGRAVILARHDRRAHRQYALECARRVAGFERRQT